MSEDLFIVVPLPTRSDGVGRALQAAFRDGLPLPPDIQNCLQRLNRVSI